MKHDSAPASRHLRFWTVAYSQPAQSIAASYYTEFQPTVIWDNGLKITAIALQRGDAAQISEFLN